MLNCKLWKNADVERPRNKAHIAEAVMVYNK